MKILKTTILIAIAFIFGVYTSHLYAQSIRLIEVPEYIGNYSTIDLLNYVSQLKAKDDASKVIPVKPYFAPVQPNSSNNSISHFIKANQA